MNRKLSDAGSETQVLTRIHGLFAAPLPADETLCPWYCRPGGVINGSALLRLAEDAEFIDAALWQIHGQESTGRQRRRWLKRLHRSSRTSILVAMRMRSLGRRRAVRIPGICLALLVDPPGRRLLGNGPVGRTLDRLRNWLVAWRRVRCLKKSTAGISRMRHGAAPQDSG